MFELDNLSLKGTDEDYLEISFITISFQKIDEEPLIYGFYLSELAPMC